MRPGPKSVARDAISRVAWHQWSVGREEPGRKDADRAVVPRAGCTCPLRSAPWAVALLATGLSACRSPPRSEREGTCACCRLPDLRVIPVWAPQPPKAPSHRPLSPAPPNTPPQAPDPPLAAAESSRAFQHTCCPAPLCPGRRTPSVSAECPTCQDPFSSGQARTVVTSPPQRRQHLRAGAPTPLPPKC